MGVGSASYLIIIGDDNCIRLYGVSRDWSIEIVHAVLPHLSGRE